MEIRFFVDPGSGLPHIYDHAVGENEVEEILENPGEDRRGREGSRIAVGQTEGGRYLRVVYLPEGPNRVFVITAYELSDKQLMAYRRRRRRKHR